MNVRYELKYRPSKPTLRYDADMVSYVTKAAIETFGRDDIFVDYRSMAGEDFAEFSQRVPSVLYFIGNGNEEKGTHYPHHHPKFNIDEDTLKYGVEMHVRTALNFLNDQN
mgnify:CR=1 FL=1